ncbi:MAG: arylsulfotransferase family protein [Verrucomicrobiota bacterium]
MKTRLFFSLLFSASFSSIVWGAPAERLVIGAEGRKGIAIVDPAKNNEVLWHETTGPVHDLHLLPNLNLLSQDGWTKIVEFSLSGERVWTYDASLKNREETDGKIEIHAFQRLPGGYTMIAESGTARLIEIDITGKITKKFPFSLDEKHHHSDTRLVRKLENGHYLVAHENNQRVKEYDSEGKVVWDFGIPLFGTKPKKGHGPDAFGGKCFAAIKAANGNYLITTGNGHSVLEVTPEKEIVWKLSQGDLEGITLAWVTTIEERPGGTLIIGNCHAGPENPQIIELTRDKEVVWTFRDFDTFGNALSNSLVVDGEPALQIRERLSQ